MSPRRAAAFTLVELLVVVALIAALLSILIPGLAAARTQAKRAACLANVRSVAQGWRAFLDENRDKFYRGTNAHLNYGGWRGTEPVGLASRAINPQLQLPLIATVDDARVFRCPADTGNDTVAPSYYNAYGNSYLANRMLVAPEQFRIDASDPAGDALSEVVIKLERVNNASQFEPAAEIVLVGDAGWDAALDISRGPAREAPTEWHARRATHNLAFLDGHAAFTRIRRAIYVDSPAYTVIPFRDEAARVAALQQERP